jgi:hypothetical protein
MLFLWAPPSIAMDMFSLCLYGWVMGALVCYLGGLSDLQQSDVQPDFVFEGVRELTVALKTSENN